MGSRREGKENNKGNASLGGIVLVIFLGFFVSKREISIEREK
jgi:hypothetical protein